MPTDPCATAACDVPMWPNGAECVKRAGHDGPHQGLTDNITWTYTACWHKSVIYGQEYVCLLPQGHDGGHANG